MRDIKFRVWNNEYQYFVKPNNFGYMSVMIRLDGKVFQESNIIINEVNTWTIQQYTGVEDKDGKEIYEGDILEYRKSVGCVDFIAGIFVCNWLDQTDDVLGYMIKNDMKVIGNIFENPELY